jgi:hypothetical protein
MMIEGYTDLEIRNRLNISERNWFKTYKPRLNEKWRQAWVNKQNDEIYHYAQVAQDQLQDALNNVRKKAREPRSNPNWGDLEFKGILFLFKFRSGGLISLNNAELKRLVQDSRGQGTPIG